jgi:hypothetical protein
MEAGQAAAAAATAVTAAVVETGKELKMVRQGWPRQQQQQWRRQGVLASVSMHCSAVHVCGSLYLLPAGNLVSVQQGRP